MQSSCIVGFLLGLNSWYCLILKRGVVVGSIGTNVLFRVATKKVPIVAAPPTKAVLANLVTSPMVV